MMFVLSVGFLMAQGVFTYQAVVVDNDGNLVANQTVNATVTITYGNPEIQVSQTLDGIQTSRNGLALLPIGGTPDFQSIDWKTAKIQVDFKVTSDATVIPGQLEQVPAVPVALQTNADLTTPMIVEYIKNADMDDVRAILAAMEQGTPKLKDTLLATAVDTAKANYELAKQVFLHYVSHATEEDIDTLYKSLMTNQELVNVIDTVLANFVKANKEDVYDVLRAYALQLDGTDVKNIWDTIPGNVKDYIVTEVISYLTTDDTNGTAKSQIIIPIIKNYAKTMTNAELKRLIEALEHNTEAYPVMLAQFNKWMDDYFSVDSAVKIIIEDRYYVCNDDVDLCHLRDTLLTLTDTCFKSAQNTFTFPTMANADGWFVQTFTYTGSPSFNYTLSDIYPIRNNTQVSIAITPNNAYVQVNADTHTITVGISEDAFSAFLEANNMTDVSYFLVNIVINQPCLTNGTLTISGIYGE
jgi:DNA-binding protein Fis